VNNPQLLPGAHVMVVVAVEPSPEPSVDILSWNCCKNHYAFCDKNSDKNAHSNLECRKKGWGMNAFEVLKENHFDKII